jgi:hypothetical protein
MDVGGRSSYGFVINTVPRPEPAEGAKGFGVEIESEDRGCFPRRLGHPYSLAVTYLLPQIELNFSDQSVTI